MRQVTREVTRAIMRSHEISHENSHEINNKTIAMTCVLRASRKVYGKECEE